MTGKSQILSVAEIPWKQFAKKNNLTGKQFEQFQCYYSLLIKANELFNITAITDLESVLAYHFEDSLILGKKIDLTAINSIADVGTGGGFPGIPLKIMYPHLNVTLIEVTQKKVAFLNDVIETLGLTGIKTCDLDWRTFLRKSTEPIDLFCARASLQPDELLRIFAQGGRYEKSVFVYWASHEWQPNAKQEYYLKKCYSYAVGDRQRNYCIFSAQR